MKGWVESMESGKGRAATPFPCQPEPKGLHPQNISHASDTCGPIEALLWMTSTNRRERKSRPNDRIHSGSWERHTCSFH